VVIIQVTDEGDLDKDKGGQICDTHELMMNSMCDIRERGESQLTLIFWKKYSCMCILRFTEIYNRPSQGRSQG
jgi:hypothetical protein